MAEGNQTDEIAIYDAENGIFEVRVEKGTVWLSQAQLQRAFPAGSVRYLPPHEQCLRENLGVLNTALPDPGELRAKRR